MTLRYDDEQKTLTLAVHDVIHEGMPRGHLTIEVVRSTTARLAAGRAAHTTYQEERGLLDTAFRAEVRLKHQVGIGEWTAIVHGRMDGLSEESGRTVVEEVKSTALDGTRLAHTTVGDWGTYVEQLEIYLWMLDAARYPAPLGRLVLVSLADSSRHVIQVELEGDRVARTVIDRLTELVEARERYLAWMASRRAIAVMAPFPSWRPGQTEISDGVNDALEAGKPVLVQAPTGMGKTAAILHGVLRHALRRDKRVFWATSRTTQQPVVAGMLARFVDAGMPLRIVPISAREKVCLNDVVACRPDACPYAHRYYDKLRETGLVPRLAVRGRLSRQDLEWAGRTAEVCPFELSLDVSEQVDVVVGDYNYAFDPAVHLRRHFGDDATARDWVVVVDEAHQLVDRARSYLSPSLRAEAVDAALAQLELGGTSYAPFASLARQVRRALSEAALTITGPERDGSAVAEPSLPVWQDLADRIDEVGIDYATLKAERPLVAPGDRDAWLDLARAVLRFASLLADASEDTVCLVRPGVEISLCCLDPSRFMGPAIARLGGFVGCSATLTPSRFYRDLLGLQDDVALIGVGSAFPAENRRVIIAPRVSTAWRDRAAHAAPTAELLGRCIQATPGNVAVYFPSFAMLQDLTARLNLEGRELLRQEPSMDEDRRQEWLTRLTRPGPPVVLAAVLGGIFAEGIDLPPGALSAILVTGPALPPVGLERDLLRDHYEQKYGRGFLYASLIPGMTRVVQAAGRLIRRPEDRGVIVLVGRRFRFREYADLLPRDWVVTTSDEPERDVAGFWETPCG